MKWAKPTSSVLKTPASSKTCMKVIPIDMSHHTNIVNDPAVPATESSSGLTAGSHCADCGKVIVAQKPTTWTPTLSWLLTHVPSWEQAEAFANANKNQTINFCWLDILITN